jgi:hypothetical protein
MADAIYANMELDSLEAFDTVVACKKNAVAKRAEADAKKRIADALGSSAIKEKVALYIEATTLLEGASAALKRCTKAELSRTAVVKCNLLKMDLVIAREKLRVAEGEQRLQVQLCAAATDNRLNAAEKERPYLPAVLLAHVESYVPASTKAVYQGLAEFDPRLSSQKQSRWRGEEDNSSDDEDDPRDFKCKCQSSWDVEDVHEAGGGCQDEENCYCRYKMSSHATTHTMHSRTYGLIRGACG